MQAIGRAYVQFQQEMPYRFDACSRFHAHQAEGYPAEDACAAAGDAVIAVIVQSLQQGQSDGTIRKDIGHPVQVCVMLWAFTHGLIQIASQQDGRDRAPGRRDPAAHGRLVRHVALHARGEARRLIFLARELTHV